MSHYFKIKVFHQNENMIKKNAWHPFISKLMDLVTLSPEPSDSESTCEISEAPLISTENFHPETFIEDQSDSYEDPWKRISIEISITNQTYFTIN